MYFIIQGLLRQCTDEGWPDVVRLLERVSPALIITTAWPMYKHIQVKLQQISNYLSLVPPVCLMELAEGAYHNR